jgi:hypothetical protein
VSPVKYELGFYIPEDDILHSHCPESLKSYIISHCFSGLRIHCNAGAPSTGDVSRGMQH